MVPGWLSSQEARLAGQRAAGGHPISPGSLEHSNLCQERLPRHPGIPGTPCPHPALRCPLPGALTTGNRSSQGHCQRTDSAANQRSWGWRRWCLPWAFSSPHKEKALASHSDKAPSWGHPSPKVTHMGALLLMPPRLLEFSHCWTSWRGSQRTHPETQEKKTARAQAAATIPGGSAPWLSLN